MTAKQTGTADSRNRHIEQEAQTDSDLETVVPPTTPFGGPTTWWRIGAAAVGIAVIVFALLQAF